MESIQRTKVVFNGLYMGMPMGMSHDLGFLSMSSVDSSVSSLWLTETCCHCGKHTFEVTVAKA